MENYYTIIRKYYGSSDLFDFDLGKENNAFLFESENQAYECLSLCFNNGAWIDDIQYGTVRYYVKAREYNYTCIDNYF